MAEPAGGGYPSSPAAAAVAVQRSPTDASTTSATSAVSTSRFLGAGGGATATPQGNIEQRFEEDFSQHLKKSNKAQRWQLGALGAGVGGMIGVAASPVLLPGLAVAAIVGGAGGYQLSKRWGKQELQRQGKSGDLTDEASLHGPPLRRLRYLVRWAHWQLLEYEDAPAQWRCTVLDETLRAFSPWVQRMYLLAAKGQRSEEDPEAWEVFQHLAPLYYWLQRRAALEAISQSVHATLDLLAAGALDDACEERCALGYPTVLETISAVDRLSAAAHTQLEKESAPSASAATAFFGGPRANHKRHRLRRIVDTIRAALEREDLRKALADLRRSRRASAGGAAHGADSSPGGAPTSTPKAPPESPGQRALVPRKSPVKDRRPRGPGFSDDEDNSPLQLVVPPEGVENEEQDMGCALDAEEWYSVSGDSGAEDAASRKGMTPKRSKRSAAGSLPSPGLRAAELGDAAAAASSGAPAAAVAAACGAECAEDDDVRMAPFRQRLEALPRGGADHTWAAFDPGAFDVRARSYLKDRRKAPSGESMLELLSVDFTRVGPGGPIWRAAEHPDCYPHQHRLARDDRFLLVMNWIFPPFQAVICAAVNPEAAWVRDPLCPQARIWRRFLEAGEEERKDLFKLIVYLENGPWLVKRVCPKKPVLIGNKVKMESHHEPGQHLELVFDVASSRAEQVACAMVIGALRKVHLVYGVLIEAREEEELPENLLMTASAKNFDPSKIFSPVEETS